MKSRAEDKLDRINRQQQRTIEEKENAQKVRAEHVARLRALRLAKDASDKEAKDDAPPVKKKQQPYPVPHRR